MMLVKLFVPLFASLTADKRGLHADCRRKFRNCQRVCLHMSASYTVLRLNNLLLAPPSLDISPLGRITFWISGFFGSKALVNCVGLVSSASTDCTSFLSFFLVFMPGTLSSNTIRI